MTTPTDDRLAALAAACAAQIADHVGPWQEMRPHDQGVILAALRTVRAEAAGAEVKKPTFVCPCCGRLTLTEDPAGGTYEICRVCWWEVDPVQGRDPDYPVGANRVSLNQARANYQRIGVSERRFIGFDYAPAALPDAAGGEGE